MADEYMSAEYMDLGAQLRQNVDATVNLGIAKFKDIEEFFERACKLAGGTITRSDYGGKRCIFRTKDGRTLGAVSLAETSADIYEIQTDIFVGNNREYTEYTRSTILYADSGVCKIRGSEKYFELECYDASKPADGKIRVSFSKVGNTEMLIAEDSVSHNRVVFNKSRIAKVYSPGE